MVDKIGGLLARRTCEWMDGLLDGRLPKTKNC